MIPQPAWPHGSTELQRKKQTARPLPQPYWHPLSRRRPGDLYFSQETLGVLLLGKHFDRGVQIFLVQQ